MANMKGVAIGVLTSVLAIILVLQIFASSSGEIVAGANNITDTLNGTRTTLPLTGLFSSSGIIMLIIVAGILLTTIAIALKRT